jgi:hypothetical protein
MKTCTKSSNLFCFCFGRRWWTDATLDSRAQCKQIEAANPWGCIYSVDLNPTKEKDTPRTTDWSYRPASIAQILSRLFRAQSSQLKPNKALIWRLGEHQNACKCNQCRLWKLPFSCLEADQTQILQNGSCFPCFNPYFTRVIASEKHSGASYGAFVPSKCRRDSSPSFLLWVFFPLPFPSPLLCSLSTFVDWSDLLFWSRALFLQFKLHKGNNTENTRPIHCLFASIWACSSPHRLYFVNFSFSWKFFLCSFQLFLSCPIPDLCFFCIVISLSF